MSPVGISCVRSAGDEGEVGDEATEHDEVDGLGCSVPGTEAMSGGLGFTGRGLGGIHDGVQGLHVGLQPGCADEAEAQQDEEDDGLGPGPRVFGLEAFGGEVGQTDQPAGDMEPEVAEDEDLCGAAGIGFGKELGHFPGEKGGPNDGGEENSGAEPDGGVEETEESKGGGHDDKTVAGCHESPSVWLVTGEWE